jgi:hypothetical protein
MDNKEIQELSRIFAFEIINKMNERSRWGWDYLNFEIGPLIPEEAIKGVVAFLNDPGRCEHLATGKEIAYRGVHYTNGETKNWLISISWA